MATKTCKTNFVQAGVTKVCNKCSLKEVKDTWKSRKFKRHPPLKKVILDHAPADYIPKIINDPFKTENPSTDVSLYFADLLY